MGGQYSIRRNAVPPFAVAGLIGFLIITTLVGLIGRPNAAGSAVMVTALGSLLIVSYLYIGWIRQPVGLIIEDDGIILHFRHLPQRFVYWDSIEGIRLLEQGKFVRNCGSIKLCNGNVFHVTYPIALEVFNACERWIYGDESPKTG